MHFSWLGLLNITYKLYNLNPESSEIMRVWHFTFYFFLNLVISTVWTFFLLNCDNNNVNTKVETKTISMKTFFKFEMVGANSCGIQLLLMHENCFNFCNFSFNERNKTAPQKVIVEDPNRWMMFRCVLSLSIRLSFYK